MSATAIAHTNIALIKYWGKADPALRLPLTNSLSMTLDKFYTQTTLNLQASDQFFLNNAQQTGQSAERVFTYLHRLERRLQLPTKHYLVNSINHVPTSAGLASSSSAFAALAAAFAQLHHLDLTKQELSILARLGSGSATRSIFGGFAEWQTGTDQTSYAIPIDEHPQLDLQLLVVELDQAPKKISSTIGMQRAQTSPFYQTWLDRNPSEIAQMKAAIQAGNFDQIGKLAELNANEMHALNLTAQEPFTYFEPATIKLIKLVQDWRADGLACYYTMDAGPNVKILTSLKNSKVIRQRLAQLLPSAKIVVTNFGTGVKSWSNSDME
ncbi:MAG: diphosphomevalonate decarboxylase [Lactobacillus sp.]|jgi:diphosphomevalonate decarboxylase|nr:diphosphomevalonate decarboxylase [Lactobacillus sp.]MCI1481611.1 diphosphomevalonate decarboxylase [Lactobacillus sp.]